MSHINDLLNQTEWTNFEIRTLNRYYYHPQNKKICTICYSVFDKNIKNFDIFRRDCNSEYVLSGKCKSCNSVHRAKKKMRMRNDPEWYCRNLVSAIRNRAKREKLPFNISGEYLFNILVNQDFKCYYTGLPIDLTAESKNHNRPHANMGSVDKKNPTDGYIEGNIVWTIWNTNRIKNNLTHDEFILMCNLVTKLHY